LQFLQVQGLQRQPPLVQLHAHFASAAAFWRSFIFTLLFGVAPIERITI
jgi:hypothetical protein